MASLHIDFSYDDNVKRSINGAKSLISTRINDYSGIKRSINNMDSSSNLTNANSYIQKKINSLENKKEKLDGFHRAVTNFNTNAEAADRRVANRINTQTNQFCKREGIKTGILYIIGSVIGKGVKWLKGEIEKAFEAFVAGIKTTWQNIKDWYEDNKHWFDIVIDAVCVIAAVVGLIATILSGGTALALFIGIVVGVWGVMKASADLVYDVQAYGAYKEGDMDRYEELSSKGLKHYMSEKLGPAGEYLYYGMEIVSAVYSIYKIGNSVYEWGIKGKPFYKIPNGAVGTKWYSLGANGDLNAITKIEKFKDIAGFDKVLKGIRITEVISSNAAFGLKTGKNFLTAENFTIATIKSIKITKIGWDLAENGHGIVKLTSTLITGSSVSNAKSLSTAPIAKIKVNFSLISAPVCMAA